MRNLGIDIGELIGLLSRGHEAVFTLKGKEYIIQSETEDSENIDLVLYQYKPCTEYLCCIPMEKDTAVKIVLNTKCFDNKSFMDLIDHIHIKEIY